MHIPAGSGYTANPVGSLVASNYDITFLRLLMEQQLTEKPQAMRCLQVIDEQAQRGQPVNAAQVAVRMGLVNQEIAQRFDAMARSEIQRGVPPAGTGRFQAPSGTGRYPAAPLLPSHGHRNTEKSLLAKTISFSPTPQNI